MNHPFTRFLCLFAALLISIPANAAEPIHIGVLAFRPKPQTLEQWQPLAKALKQAIPEYDFEVLAYTYPELERATAGKHLEFVLTNPGHYVLLSKRIGLTAPLATLALNENGRTSMQFGGVVFSRSDRSDVQSLQDLKGLTIAAASVDSLGGYQMQSYELSRIGIKVPKHDRLLTTGMPHDKVVEAVLSGHADAGFVRTGVLEGMAKEGKLALSDIRVINRQDSPDFPLSLSTPLYPEWPFASLPSTDENIARKVAAALFMLEENSAATRAMGIHGFVVPADYTPVADLLKELRIAPFDDAPAFDLLDVWQRYRWQLIAGAIGGGLILLLGFYLMITRRRLAQEHEALQLKQRQLQASEQHLQTVILNEPECIKTIDAEGKLVQMNPAGLAMIEADSFDQVEGSPIIEMIAPEYRDAYREMHDRVISGETIQMEFEVLGLKGGRRWMETHAVPMHEGGKTLHLAVTRDITERKKLEQEIRQLAFYDALTGLPNRRLLDDRFHLALAASKRTGNKGALMFLDLDNFKPLNDDYGHSVGDRLLIEAASRLRNCVRGIDTVSRFGGDEFVILLSELDREIGPATAQARQIAEKALAALSRPYLLPVYSKQQAASLLEHHCTASIGVALFSGATDSPDDILSAADAAMYRAKEAGRNQIAFHSAHDPQP